MKTITSVSGGKTSAYMAIHYPTDEYIFAVVLTNHTPSQPKDSGLLRECRNRIPHFVASHEADLTLLNVLRLEQEIGKPVKWVAAEFSLDQFVLGQTDLPGYRSKKHLLPNSRTRFCTVEQKIKPIAHHCFLHYAEAVLMSIGFRWDERRRVEEWNCQNDKIDIAYSCPVNGGNYKYLKDFEWRIPQFPLYENRIASDDVRRFWIKKGWVFPEVSNCRFCFHHTDFQQQYQATLEPENLQWWLQMEQQTGNTFGKRALLKVLDQPLLDINESNRECFCTD
ncbi:MAG: hypothetical protein ACRC62_15510 [Microcoleus sp.]